MGLRAWLAGKDPDRAVEDLPQVQPWPRVSYVEYAVERIGDVELRGRLDGTLRGPVMLTPSSASSWLEIPRDRLVAEAHRRASVYREIVEELDRDNSP